MADQEDTNQRGLPVGRYVVLRPQDWPEGSEPGGEDDLAGHPERKRVLDEIADLGWPLFVKPARGGSSIGTSKAHAPAQLRVSIALARSYGLPNWPRLVTACRMTDAIWRGDVDTVRQLVLKNPQLLHESARGIADSNWGPPMSYAANVGQDAISRCCARWELKIFSMRSTGRACKASSKPRAVCTPWARASFRAWPWGRAKR